MIMTFTSLLSRNTVSELDSFLSKPVAAGWTAKGDVVEVPVNKDNVVKTAGVVREETDLSDLSRLLQQAAPSAPTAAPAVKA